MTPFDNLHWANLQTATGDALAVPGFLENLSLSTKPQTSSTQDPWYSLWSMLCHQGEIYTASYAAAPLIIQIGVAAQWPIDPNFLLLPASIEHARLLGAAPPLPVPLKHDYITALSLLPNLLATNASREWDRTFTKAALYTLAVTKGHLDLADLIDV